MPEHLSCLYICRFCCHQKVPNQIPTVKATASPTVAEKENVTRKESEAVNMLQALSCCIYIYMSITLHAIQTKNLTLTQDHNLKGAKLNLSVLGTHRGSLALSWYPVFQVHGFFHSSSKKNW